MNIANNTSLRTLTTGFQALFAQGFEEIASRNPAIDDWKKLARVVPSTTADEEYGWLEDTGNIREWLGDREIQRMKLSGYRIRNKDFEGTKAVNVNDISDNRLGKYAIPMQALGADVREFPGRLVFELLAKAHTEACYDGQNFFDADHPVTDDKGKTTVYSNTATGGGAPWYLIDTTKFMTPILFQEREKFKFVAKDKDTDDNVFERKEMVYGVDGRCNVGFGLWQLAYRSTKPLGADSLQEARVAMGTLKNSKGRPMGVNGTLLVCGWSNDKVARELLKRDIESGSTNINRNLVDLLVTPYVE